jgi:hypothetical protein
MQLQFFHNAALFYLFYCGGFDKSISQIVAEGEVIVITEPETTNCFSIDFQVNIMILSRTICVYLHFTPLLTS